MNRVMKMTPDQLKVVVDSILNSYKKDYENGLTSDPHFEHVNAGGYRFKIGYIPDVNGGKTLIDIKIVYKGRI